MYSKLELKELRLAEHNSSEPAGEISGSAIIIPGTKLSFGAGQTYLLPPGIWDVKNRWF